MYLSELAPRRVRGSMTSVNTVMIDVGQLVAYAVGAALAASGEWRIMLGLSAAPAAAQAVGMVWMPESPAWLAGKGLRRQAEEIARRTSVAADEAEGGRTGASRRLFEGGGVRRPFQRRRGGGGRDRVRLRLRPTVLVPRLFVSWTVAFSDDRRVRRARVRARGPPPATPPGGDPSGAAAGGGYQRGDVLRRDDHSSRGGLRRRRRRPPRPRRRRHVRPRFRPRSPRRGRVRTTPRAPRVAPGMRRRVGGAHVLVFWTSSGDPHRPSRKSPRGRARPPRPACRECLAASCGFCAARTGRGTRAVPGGHSRGTERREGTEEELRGVRHGTTRGRDTRRTPSRRRRRRRRRRSTSSTSRRTRRRSRTFWPPRGMRYHRRRPPRPRLARNTARIRTSSPATDELEFHSCPSRLGLL